MMSVLSSGTDGAADTPTGRAAVTVAAERSAGSELRTGGNGPEAERTKMRIGEVAELTGTTPRTIRYYEELGLLGTGSEREQGKHRCYSDSDVERISEIVRLRDLLGLSLEQLCQLVEAETARAEIRRELGGGTADAARRRELLHQADSHIETQLGLVQSRLGELRALESTLLEKRAVIAGRLADLD